MTSNATPERLIRRILRVDHAGEHGAISIYSRQIERARTRYPDLVPWLEETLSHEVRHRQTFRELMPERSAKPCRALSVWKYGGALLGAITGLMGRNGVYACTAAVERTVHRHLDEQIVFLSEHDVQLADAVRSIQKEEEAHLAHAEHHLNTPGTSTRLLLAFVALATECLIFLSTRGDSLYLNRRLAGTA